MINTWKPIEITNSCGRSAQVGSVFRSFPMTDPWDLVSLSIHDMVDVHDGKYTYLFESSFEWSHTPIDEGLCTHIYIPGAPMTCIFEGQSPKTRPFPTKTMVIWVLGIYIYNDSRIPITHRIHGTNGIFTYMKTIKNPPIKAGFLWVGSPYPCHHGKLRVPTSPMPRGNPQEIAGPNSRPC